MASSEASSSSSASSSDLVTCIGSHPLVASFVAELRSIETKPNKFRKLVKKISVFLAYEASKDLSVVQTKVQTPICEADAVALSQRIAIVPILRAGLGMAEGLQTVFPEAQTWHLGLFRDPVTCQPVPYYNKLPSACNVDIAYVLDPMCATAGSVRHVIRILKEWGVKQIKFLCLLASQFGIDTLRAEHPDVMIYCAQIDEKMNEKSYIVPGLGDAGDRLYHTEDAHH